MLLVVLDCGSQYTQLIRRAYEELDVAVVVVDGDAPAQEVMGRHGQTAIAGVVISGSATSTTTDPVGIDEAWLDHGVPVLGVCFGHQWLAQRFGGAVRVAQQGFAGERLQVMRANRLIPAEADGGTVWVSHRDTVTDLGPELVAVARTPESPVAAFQHVARPVYGLQFHPEVSHSSVGTGILRAFAEICGLTVRPTPWCAAQFVDASIGRIRQVVRGDRVLVALSGGVDSSALCALLARALSPNQVVAVYVDSGLMEDKSAPLTAALCTMLEVPYLTWDASARFFTRLSGVVDPTEKCLVVGRTFADELATVADTSGCRFLAQGTIWSDVIESGATRFSSRIKPHHNVVGMPSQTPFELLEPLRELFKDQVRSLARHLDLPREYSERRVFPGPGFAIRVQGPVTPDKVAIVRRASLVVEQEVDRLGLGESIWMAFAVLLQVSSLGVQGDLRRENEWAIAVRIVESTNSMTARYSRQAYRALEAIAGRLVRETPVGRVVYDITDKPPATIEWE